MMYGMHQIGDQLDAGDYYENDQIVEGSKDSDKKKCGVKFFGSKAKDASEPSAKAASREETLEEDSETFLIKMNEERHMAAVTLQQKFRQSHNTTAAAQNRQQHKTTAFGRNAERVAHAAEADVKIAAIAVNDAAVMVQARVRGFVARGNSMRKSLIQVTHTLPTGQGGTKPSRSKEQQTPSDAQRSTSSILEFDSSRASYLEYSQLEHPQTNPALVKEFDELDCFGSSLATCLKKL